MSMRLKYLDFSTAKVGFVSVAMDIRYKTLPMSMWVILDHVVIDANGLIIWEIVGSYVIDVNDLVID